MSLKYKPASDPLHPAAPERVSGRTREVWRHDGGSEREGAILEYVGGGRPGATLPLGIQPRGKSLRSSYTGLYPQTE